MNENTNVDLLNCNYAKTILMILIVICHSAAFWTGKWFTADPIYDCTLLAWLSNWLGTFHVHCFCLISGYIFFYLKYEKNSVKYNNFLIFIKTKFKRLVLPYIFIAVVWVVPITECFFHQTIKDIIIKYVFAVSPSQLWFLIMLFDVFLIFYMLSSFLCKHLFLGIIILLTFYGIGVAMSAFLPNVFSVFTAFKFLIFFYLGFIIRKHHLLLYLKKLPSVLWILLDIVFVILYNKYVSAVGILSIPCTLFINIFGAVASFSVLQSIACRVDWNIRYFRLLCKHSMTIYLLHQQIIYFTVKWLNSVLNPYLHFLANFVFAFVVSLVISMIMHRFRLTSYLLGENYDPKLY